jgi:radical SAM superfamily enzyme YgiQ (UPF0313 family)
MRYNHVLCLYPYLVDQRPGIGIFPPTGLEYVATALKQHVDRISLVDLRHERSLRSLERMSRFIRREGVDLICISVGWKARYHKICEYVRRLPSGPTMIVGGHQATEQVEDILQRCLNVDAVVRGEGEETAVELAQGRPWDNILGLSYRRNGTITHNPNRPLGPIEEIAPPDRSLRRSRYSPVLRGLRLLSTEFDTVVSSRGCPYKCKFCTLTLNPLGQKRNYVSRSPESVVEEIASSPARMILFADDNFFLEPQRVERICDLLIERGIDKRYAAQTRIEVFKFPRMLEKAYRAGFRVFLLGIESASDRILKQLDKGFDTRQVREAFRVLRQFPFWYHAYFIYGNVGETEEEMLAIPDFAREIGAHSIALSLLRVDKFSPLRQTIENMPGYRISSNGYVYSQEFDKKRLRRIRNQIRNRFQYRPAQIVKVLEALNRCEIVPYHNMLGLAFTSPWLLVDYMLHRGRKSITRLRRRFAPANGPELRASGS